MNLAVETLVEVTIALLSLDGNDTNAWAHPTWDAVKVIARIARRKFGMSD
jgi:hypothetical protein